MSAQPRLDPVDPLAERDTHGNQVPERAPDQTFGVWLTTRQVMAFIPCKSLKATYAWLRAHGIPRRGNRTVARRDLERELARMARKPRRVMHPHSLANLRKRSV